MKNKLGDLYYWCNPVFDEIDQVLISVVIFYNFNKNEYMFIKFRPHQLNFV